ncbi:MAG: phage GP46 family protein [Plesiomonas sp.]|uniref:phage GP46 family protein n=1 Tax=Plesiomonas sp. TaxID=2486279 RepID=UPI003F3B7E6C
MQIVINGQSVDLMAALTPLQRAVVISLFTWRRAEPDDKSDVVMGYWGDTFPTVTGDKTGSRLWLLRREKTLPQVLERARLYAMEALKWITDDGVATAVSVAVYRSGTDEAQLRVLITRRAGIEESILITDFWRQLNVGV